MPKALLDYETTRSLRDILAGETDGNLNLSSNASLVFDTVYNGRLEDGTHETIPYRMAAVAIDVASQDLVYLPENMPKEQKLRHVEGKARSYLDLYTSNRFRANTPTNINFGRWRANYGDDGERTGYVMKDQLGSACFVIPIEDTFGESVENLEDGILEAWVTQQMLHKGGGGTGFSFDSLRPKGSIIGYDPHVDGLHSINWDTDRGISSGYESFLNFFFNQATDAVKQGNSRRGANMGIQRIDHMDFLDHVYAKFGRTRDRSEYRIKNFNLSLAVTDEFMEAALAGETYTLYNPHRARFREILGEDAELVRKEDLATREQFEAIMERNSRNLFAPVTTPNMYLGNDGEEVINAYSGERIGRVVNGIVHIEATRVLDIISQLSHSNGEPGMVFLDRMNEYNPILFDKEITATNPCGEQPLEAYTACNLGSVNAGKFVKCDTFETRDSINLEARIMEDEFTRVEEKPDGVVRVVHMDWDSLEDTIETAMYFLDGVIDRSDFPGEKITRAVKETRKVGLGYMGVWDAMVLMKLRYGSEESFKFAEALAKRLHDKANEASEKMAEERGVFPLWETSFYNPGSDLYKWFMSDPNTIIDKHRGSRDLSKKVERNRRMRYGFRARNSYQTTEAPTGTIRRTSGERDEELGLDNLAISSGIEPIYTLIEQSNIMNRSVEDTSWAAVQLFKREGIYSPELMKAIRANKGSAFIYSTTPPEIAEVLRTIPEDVRDVLVTAAGGDITDDSYEITNHQHTGMSISFQRWNRSANSKTNNLPASATTRDMRDAWVELWKGGAKGGTIYVDRSRKFQILNTVVDGERNKEKKSGSRRPFLQRSITLELPYTSSTPKEGVGDIDFDPDRCFTTLTFNGVNGHLTGVFQNIPETDPERLSAITDRNIERSRALKNGRPLDDVIADLEKIRYQSGRTGVAVDEAVMNGSDERMRFQVEGATTTENELKAFYVARFLTVGGTNLDPESINEKILMYESGEVTLRSIINTKGRLTIEEGSNGNPSILGGNKVIKVPEGTPVNLCPECG